ncbi:MAG TPA: hypothetical protein VNA25_01505 [Phycisphaerae bacterium]|nr:hypothetical protein [Phycisphaerae bacterium]
MTSASVHRVSLLLLWGLLASTAPGALGAQPPRQTSMPASAGRQARSEAIRPAELETRLTDAVERHVAGLGGADEADAAGTAEQLIALQRGYLESLAPYARDRDLEVRLRVRVVLDEAFDQARTARMLAYLPPANRRQLLELRRRRPRLFSEMLHHDWSRRVTAVRSLSRKTDPNRLAEPLVMLLLRHPSARLVAESSAAVIRCEYQSDGTVEALEGVLERFRNQPSSMYVYDDEYVSPYQAALNALQTITTERATCALLKLLLDPSAGRSSGYSALPCIAEAVAGAGEKRAVAVLVEGLDLHAGRGRQHWSWGAGEYRGTTDARDYALYAALKLTGQSPAAYGMIHAEYYGTIYIGFPKSGEREKAYDRMKRWWKDHRGKPPYDRPPLVVPRSRAKAAGPVAASQPATQPTALSRPAATRPAPADDAVRRDLAVGVRQLAEQLRSASFDKRTLASGRLIRLEEALLRPMTQPADSRDPRRRKRVLSVLAEMITECNLHANLCRLPDEHRDKLLACRAEHTQATRQMFSLSASHRAEAMRTVAAADDPNGIAEPLVLIALRDPVPSVAREAAKVLQAGRYGSDALMDAITEAVLAVPREQWGRSYDDESSPSPLDGIARALPKVRNPRAVPLMAAIMKRQADASLPPAEQAALLLAETGEKRLIPSLIDMLNDTSSHYSIGGKVTVTIAPSDLALMVMVKVSGQDTKDYGFIHTSYHPGKVFGFKDDKAREQAVKKFRQWWETHKNTPPYKGLKPLSIPSIPDKRPSAGQPDAPEIAG